jgi:hypothetical protein
MSTLESRLAKLRPIILTSMLLVILGLPSCHVGGCADARPAARRTHCQANLRTLYYALAKYASLHGDVPRGSDGKASLVPLNGNRSRAGEQRGCGLVTEVGFHGRCQVGKDRAAL